MRSTAHAFTLVEMALVMGILGVMLLVASSRLQTWRQAAAASGAARSLESAFSLARGEAIRTGHNHLLFFGSDASGAPLADADGNPVEVLVLDDGRPGSAGQNCQIDAGEPIHTVAFEPGIGFGTSSAPGLVPQDPGSALTGGSSFEDPNGNPANWVLFRSDGIPRAADSACASGPVGSGGGGAYLGNAERDLAIVLAPLGAARVFRWDRAEGVWE